MAQLLRRSLRLRACRRCWACRRSRPEAIRQPPQGKAAAGQALGAAKVLADQAMQALLLELVHRFHGLEQLGHVAGLLRSAHQGLHIFEETRSAVAAARPDELEAIALRLLSQ